MPTSPIRKFRLSDADWTLLGYLAELKRTKSGKYGVNLSAVVRDLIHREAAKKLGEKGVEKNSRKSKESV
jgi:hypothetical protein